MKGPSRTWRGLAHAKVNLRLKVLGREPDGYHQLETVFQRLQLADEVELSAGGEAAEKMPSVRLAVTGVPEGALGPDSENLAVRAAQGFLEALGDAAQRPGAAVLASGIAIRLGKRIPSGAGLGGGSSDAAAVLHGLNELADAPFDREELRRIGGGLGSDVPFFLSGASRALGLGRGDRITPLPALPTRHVLLAVPLAPISTAWAYNVLVEARAGVQTTASDKRIQPSDGEGGAPGRASEKSWAEVADAAHNDFETSLFPLRRDLARLKQALSEAGARPALLSGSGAVVFGAFQDVTSMEGAADRVLAVDPTVHVIRTRTEGP